MGREFNWPAVLFYLHIHVLGVLGLYMAFYYALLFTTLFALVLVALGVLGVTAGAHRLWAHRCYDANKTLRIFLMLCQTLAGQGSIYDWVLMHRLHHKYFETDLDPYNPKKGFWYAHLFNLTRKLSEDQLKALEEIDMSDLKEDSVVMFQKKYYWVLFIVLFLLLPINAPAEYWGENLINSLVVVGWLRHALVLHMSYLIHSGSRLWGIDKDITRLWESNSIFFINKTHWIRYHYFVPWDYLTSEYGSYGSDLTSQFIRICAASGYAYNLKSMSTDAVRAALYESTKLKSDEKFEEVLNDDKKQITLPTEQYQQVLKYI